MPTSYSISFRLRRITVEAAHVSVPLTPEFMQAGLENSARLEADRMAEAALEMGRLPSTVWKPDGEAEITLHPLQTPPDQE